MMHSRIITSPCQIMYVTRWANVDPQIADTDADDERESPGRGGCGFLPGIARGSVVSGEAASRPPCIGWNEATVTLRHADDRAHGKRETDDGRIVNRTWWSDDTA